MINKNNSGTDSNGMPSATGQPYPASQGEFVSPLPKKKTSDTSMSDEIDKEDIPEGYHRMPDGTLMANSEHEEKYVFAGFARDHTKVQRLTELF